MILALEGPDKSGKSTLFEALRSRLRGAVFVARLPLPEGLQPFMHRVEVRDEALWAALYRPELLYVCDRHFSVSGPVYDGLYGRATAVDWRRWAPEVRVLYLRAPAQELARRLASDGDQFCRAEHYAPLSALYSEHLRSFKHAAAACLPVELLVELTVALLEVWDAPRAA